MQHAMWQQGGSAPTTPLLTTPLPGSPLSADYVAGLFSSYSGHFEAQLVGELRYIGHEAVVIRVLIAHSSTLQ